MVMLNYVYQYIDMKMSHRGEEDIKKIPHSGFQQLFHGREPIECLLERKSAYETEWRRTNKIINVNTPSK
jgi:hypothetical protein